MSRRLIVFKRVKPPIENQTPAQRMSHMRGAARKSPRAYSKLSFWLCPQTPDYEERAFCEAKAMPFTLIPGGYGGTASVNNEPQAHCFQASEAPHREPNSRAAHVPHARSGVEITACVFKTEFLALPPNPRL